MSETTKDAKAKGIDVDVYAERATKSSRAFVARLADAILTIPRIKEKSQEAADEKAYKMLDSLYDAFVKAQSDAIKFAVADICNGMGMESSLYPLAN